MIAKYEGKVAVVTGAANGLGRALVNELGTRKCRLILMDVDGASLDGVQSDLLNQGIEPTVHRVDVSDQSEVEAVAREIKQSHGAIDLLVNNAGISASASFANTSAAEFERIMQVNFFGTVNCCRAFLPLLGSNGEGQILNVSSCFAWLGYPRKTAYSASKAAISGFSESLRHELAVQRIGVSILYPGPLNTGIVRKGTNDSPSQAHLEEQFLGQRGLPLDRVARQTFNRLRRNPQRIVIGFDYRILDLMARLWPSMAAKAVALAASRGGF